jgi:hypothetical protein
MATKDADILQVLKSELEFLEREGYDRSPRTPWRPPLIFEDSPSCIRSHDPERLSLCKDCALMHFVPVEHRSDAYPCRSIPLNAENQTVDSFYRWGTKLELEDALRKWLRKTIKRLELEQASRDRGKPAPAEASARNSGCAP